MSANVAPHPGLAQPHPATPTASALRERRQAFDEDEEDEMDTPVNKALRPAVAKAKQEQQLIAGVLNEIWMHIQIDPPCLPIDPFPPHV